MRALSCDLSGLQLVSLTRSVPLRRSESTLPQGLVFSLVIRSTLLRSSSVKQLDVLEGEASIRELFLALLSGVQH